MIWKMVYLYLSSKLVLVFWGWLVFLSVGGQCDDRSGNSAANFVQLEDPGTWVCLTGRRARGVPPTVPAPPSGSSPQRGIEENRGESKRFGSERVHPSGAITPQVDLGGN
ncbi:hypothetical protein QBC39DRAFT_343478 [Podospora conica]|nr:hypothetical protein QBC39DRAFT_343478 [Schizothecium conicum]